MAQSTDAVRALLDKASKAYHEARGENASYAAKFDDGISQALDACSMTDHAVDVVGVVGSGA